MLKYVLKRLLHSAVVLCLVSFFVFFVSRLAGDPAALMAPPTAGPEDVEVIRRALGLDRPLPEQYLRFLANAVRGDFGMSLWQQQPVFTLIAQRLPATLELAAAALLIALVAGLPLGIFAAVTRNSPFDRAATVVAVFAQSVPAFFMGISLIMIFAVTLGWLPAFGRGTPSHLVMPAFTLSALTLAQVTRLMRSGLLEILAEDYIRTARAKGLPPPLIMTRHALRNAAIPVVTMIGLQVGALIGSAVVVETVFAWPGIGQLAIQAVMRRDFPLVQATALFGAVTVLAANLAVDLSYMVLDPRIRLR